jgi:uncharacterized protein
VPQIKQAGIERAVRVAVERERAAWRLKLEHGRARFRQMIGTVASAGQAFEKLQVLVEQAASEWAALPAVNEAPALSVNHRPNGAAKRVNHRSASTEIFNGQTKLGSGERRILTALAQYPQGRSKVQLAILCGYAHNGGAFNNYLGALRTRGLIQGNAERLTITQPGIEVLGSWEPLPTGHALDYWRERLGKAERLIFETLTQSYPDTLSKEEVAAKAGYEANGGGFNNAVSRLRTLELIEGRGELRASDSLFDTR